MIQALTFFPRLVAGVVLVALSPVIVVAASFMRGGDR